MQCDRVACREAAVERVVVPHAVNPGARELGEGGEPVGVDRDDDHVDPLARGHRCQALLHCMQSVARSIAAALGRRLAAAHAHDRAEVRLGGGVRLAVRHEGSSGFVAATIRAG